MVCKLRSQLKTLGKIEEICGTRANQHFEDQVAEGYENGVNS